MMPRCYLQATRVPEAIKVAISSNAPTTTFGMLSWWISPSSPSTWSSLHQPSTRPDTPRSDMRGPVDPPSFFETTTTPPCSTPPPEVRFIKREGYDSLSLPDPPPREPFPAPPMPTPPPHDPPLSPPPPGPEIPNVPNTPGPDLYPPPEPYPAPTI